MKTFYSRQSKACPNKFIKDLNILVVGCGAIGRQVARQVALLGPASITICDFDSIEEHNCVPQMFPISAIGQKKVDYLSEELCSLCPDTVKIVAHCDQWFPVVGNHFDVVFPCVDNIEVRGKIFEYYQEKCKAFFDVRIGGDEIMVLNAIGEYQDKEWYKSTLFKKSEAHNAGCAQPMTNYVANIASGIAVNNFAKWCAKRGAPIDKILHYSTLDDCISHLTEEIFKNEEVKD